MSENYQTSVFLFINPWEKDLSETLQSYILGKYLVQEELCQSIYFLGKNSTFSTAQLLLPENTKAIFTGSLPAAAEFITQTIGIPTLYLGVSPSSLNFTGGR